jgi:hypothetical protein
MGWSERGRKQDKQVQATSFGKVRRIIRSSSVKEPCRRWCGLTMDQTDARWISEKSAKRHRWHPCGGYRPFTRSYKLLPASIVSSAAQSPCSVLSTAPARSPMITHGAMVLPVIARGMTEASAIVSPFNP